jgi:hypothetical protein
MPQAPTAISMEAMVALAEREYIVEGYVEASEHYARFRLGGKHGDLKAAAKALCDALQRLQEDSGFFDALQRTVEDAEETPLGDLDKFLADHFEILTKLGLTPAEAERLLDDFRYALDKVRKDGTWREIKQLERRIGELATVTCTAAQNAGAFRRRARSTVRVVRHALPIVAGLAIIVADSAAAVHGLHHDPMSSIRHGLGVSIGG